MSSLTLKQALLLVDAVNGLRADDRRLQAALLPAEVAKVTAMGDPDRWAVAGLALLEMIDTWSVSRRIEMIEAAEQFWTLCDANDEDGLRRVGLLAGELELRRTLESAGSDGAGSDPYLRPARKPRSEDRSGETWFSTTRRPRPTSGSPSVERGVSMQGPGCPGPERHCGRLLRSCGSGTVGGEAPREATPDP
ncbi:hypothetical protein [Nonomuraea sediminis]|uniref:hypothetical protein n=1 Tax=Nonomuraea sediminis TaxID=2835864 RepID=UPI001BDC812B|nr:hypothetical protein [Nonomuraea sediminis]